MPTICKDFYLRKINILYITYYQAIDNLLSFYMLLKKFANLFFRYNLKIICEKTKATRKLDIDFQDVIYKTLFFLKCQLLFRQFYHLRKKKQE